MPHLPHRRDARAQGAGPRRHRRDASASTATRRPRTARRSPRPTPTSSEPCLDCHGTVAHLPSSMVGRNQDECWLCHKPNPSPPPIKPHPDPSDRTCRVVSPVHARRARCRSTTRSGDEPPASCATTSRPTLRRATPRPSPPSRRRHLTAAGALTRSHPAPAPRCPMNGAHADDPDRAHLGGARRASSRASPTRPGATTTSCSRSRAAASCRRGCSRTGSTSARSSSRAPIFYRPEGGTHDAPVIGHFPDAALLAGQRVLVVDEVWETGETMTEVMARVRAAGADAGVAP